MLEVRNFKLYILFLIFLLIPGFLIEVNGQDDILPDTIRTCYVDSLMLDAGSGYVTYQWSTGETTQSIWIYSSGTYSVIVTDTAQNYEDSAFVNILGGFMASTDTTINCGDTVSLSGSSQDFNYLWNPGELTGSVITVFPRDTVTYYATISDPDISWQFCIDSVKVAVEPQITVDTVMQTAMGCKDEPRATIELEVSGQYPDFTYDWPVASIPAEEPNHRLGLKDGTQVVTITDTLGCYLDFEFEVKSYPIPDLELFVDPKDTVYLQNPYMTFRFENPEYDSLQVDTFYLNWSQWNFGDNDSTTVIAPTHIYKKAGTYNVLLDFRTFYDCPGTDSIEVVVKPVNLLIPAIFTPNEDGFNDVFEIWNDEDGGGDDGTGGTGNGTTFKNGVDDPVDLSEFYLSNTLLIFNRWGEKVFETDNYQNDWDGDNLSDGTYFYVLQCVGEHRTDVFKGSVMILRK